MTNKYDLDDAYHNGYWDGEDGFINSNCYDPEGGEADLWEAYEKGYREGIDGKEQPR